jgi:hypothetical protein
MEMAVGNKLTGNLGTKHAVLVPLTCQGRLWIVTQITRMSAELRGLLRVPQSQP